LREGKAARGVIEVAQMLLSASDQWTGPTTWAWNKVRCVQPDSDSDSDSDSDFDSESDSDPDPDPDPGPDADVNTDTR
jgi:hypothetical protein